MKPGVTYRFGFPVRNDGPIPITITGLAPSFAGGEGDATHVSLAGTTPMDATAQGVVRDPFAPLTLGPGEGVGVFVDFTVDERRFDAGSSVTFNTVSLQFTAAGVVGHEAEVFLGMSIEICKPACAPLS